MAFALLSNKDATDKLFETLAGRFTERAGGYTRILRTGYRVGDGAEMAIIEYLPTEEKKAAAKGKKKAAGKTEKKAAGKTEKKAAPRGGFSGRRKRRGRSARQEVKPARAPRKSPRL
jgi:large subunit ribosomal protein L17